jgi:Na+(H+)/acetate symporter ActP
LVAVLPGPIRRADVASWPAPSICALIATRASPGIKADTNPIRTGRVFRTLAIVLTYAPADAFQNVGIVVVAVIGLNNTIPVLVDVVGIIKSLLLRAGGGEQQSQR